MTALTEIVPIADPTPMPILAPVLGPDGDKTCGEEVDNARDAVDVTELPDAVGGKVGVAEGSE